MLQEKNGKFARLDSSQDLSSEVGKGVKVLGDWQSIPAANPNLGATQTTHPDINNPAYPATSTKNGSTENNMPAADQPAGAIPLASLDHPDKKFVVSNMDSTKDSCNNSK